MKPGTKTGNKELFNMIGDNIRVFLKRELYNSMDFQQACHQGRQEGASDGAIKQAGPGASQ